MSEGRKINFGAGPAMMPFEVLSEIGEELYNYQQSGMSVLEVSHRSDVFYTILQRTKQDLKDLLKVPDNYHILFLQGGGTGQTASVPLNLIGLQPGNMADYIVTGAWSAKAAKEAAKYGTINKVLAKMDNYNNIPPQSSWTLHQDASYVFYCDNETIHGVEFKEVPNTNSIPIVCDMSSNILTRPVDVSKFGVIYAGAQKNLGCAGVTVVIVREDLINKASPVCPSVIEYKSMVNNNSILNTPPVFGIYVLGVMLKYIKKQGGVEKMYENSKTKSEAVYKVINESEGFYCCPVNVQCQSRTNIVLRIRQSNDENNLEKKFLEEASKQEMVSLKGHRSVGGIRVSLYNAVTVENVDKLVKFMKDFAIRNYVKENIED